MPKIVQSQFLNELVATEVFEEQKPTYGLDQEVYDLFDTYPSAKGAWELYFSYDEGDRPRWVTRPFLSSVKFAWKVIGKIDERFNAVADLKQIHVSEGRRPHSEWICTFYNRETGKMLGQSLPCPRVEWAICEVAVAIVKANSSIGLDQ